MRFFLVFSVVFLLFFQTKSYASTQALVTGHDFKTHCFSPYDTDSGYCAGYVTAITDLMVEHRIYGLEACNVSFIRSQQLVDTVRLYIQKNPKSLNGTARLLVAQAISEAFPCF